MKPKILINIFYVAAGGLLLVGILLRDDYGGFFNIFFWMALFIYAIGELVKGWLKIRGKLDQDINLSKTKGPKE